MITLLAWSSLLGNEPRRVEGLASMAEALGLVVMWLHQDPALSFQVCEYICADVYQVLASGNYGTTPA